MSEVVGPASQDVYEGASSSETLPQHPDNGAGSFEGFIGRVLQLVVLPWNTRAVLLSPWWCHGSSAPADTPRRCSPGLHPPPAAGELARPASAR